MFTIDVADKLVRVIAFEVNNNSMTTCLAWPSG